MPPKRPIARTRQTKINFSPGSKTHASPRPSKSTFTVASDSDSDDGPSPSRPAKRQRLEAETRRGMKLDMPTQSKRGMSGSSDNENVISSGSSSETSEGYVAEQIQPSSRKAGKKAKVRPVVISDKEDEAAQPKRGKGKRRKRAMPEDTNSEGEFTVIPRRDKRNAKKAGKNGEGKEATRSRKAPTPEESSEHDSEDEVLVTPRKTTKERKKDNVALDEEERPPKKLSVRRKKRSTPTPEPDSDAEEEDEESNGEADELKEDLAFLQSSPPGLGSTQSKAKSAREKALEAMKKKRAANSDPPSSSAARRKPVVGSDSESDSDLEIIPEEREESSDQSDESEEYYGTTAHDVLYGNDDDEEFINDDDAPIGVPAEHALPLQFSSLRNAKPRDLFKYAIEWMVQKKINPAFSSDDEIYEMTFRKLDDEVNGLASSKYHSSVWTPEFTRAIRARPDLDINLIDPTVRAVQEPHCEACNRRTHTASYEVKFSGQPYHKDTLEPLAANASDSDSDSSISSSSDVTYDDRGERLPPESKAFNLGSTCKANAQVAHTLYHWRIHLNEWVVDYLTRQGHCTAEQLVARDKWSVRKRQKFANKVVDEMEANGQVKKLHKLYKDQVNWAMEADNEYKRGWGKRG